MADIFGALLGLGFLILFVVAWTKIFTKAGYSSWMGLLMVVPIANLIVFLSLAFTDWPVLVRLRAAASQNAPQIPSQAQAGESSGLET